MNGNSTSDVVEKKPVLAVLMREAGLAEKCVVTESCPYDVSLREMIQVALNRGQNECPCCWVRKKSSFAAEINSLSECLKGKKAAWTSSILNFIHGMLSAGIRQVEEHDATNGHEEVQEQDDDVIEIVDEESEASSAAIKRRRIRKNGSSNQDEPCHDDDVDMMEIAPASIAVKDEDMIETVEAADSGKKRRKPRCAPWGKRRKASSGAPESKLPRPTDAGEGVSAVFSSSPESNKRRQTESLPANDKEGEGGGESTAKQAVTAGRVLRSNPLTAKSGLKVSVKDEFLGFTPDDTDSATYYYVLFKNFLKSDLCDVKLSRRKKLS